MDPLSTQACRECGGPFRGRADKKFCSDQCRSMYNNRRRRVRENMYIREINRILKNNREILVMLNPHGRNKVSLSKLRSRGFNFEYFTSVRKARDGGKFFFCYDQGYLPLGKDQCLLVTKDHQSD